MWLGLLGSNLEIQELEDKPWDWGRTLALRSKSFHSKRLRIQASCTHIFLIQTWLVSMWTSSCKIPKRWIKGLSKKWTGFFLSLPWRGWGVEGVHGLLLVLSPLPLLHLLYCFLQSFPSLASRVLAFFLSELERERVCCKWEDEWESEASSEIYPFLFHADMWVPFLKWQTTHFPISATISCSIGRSANGL